MGCSGGGMAGNGVGGGGEWERVPYTSPGPQMQIGQPGLSQLFGGQQSGQGLFGGLGQLPGMGLLQSLGQGQGLLGSLSPFGERQQKSSFVYPLRRQQRFQAPDHRELPERETMREGPIYSDNELLKLIQQIISSNRYY